jgi:hypothetical protein
MAFSGIFDPFSIVLAKQACGYSCLFGKGGEKVCAGALNK